jgi:hypothetical protein
MGREEEGRQGRERRGGREEREGSRWVGGERRRERDRTPLTPALSEEKKYLLYHCWQSVAAASPLPHRKIKNLVCKGLVLWCWHHQFV